MKPYKDASLPCHVKYALKNTLKRKHAAYEHIYHMLSKSVGTEDHEHMVKIEKYFDMMERSIKGLLGEP